MTRPDDMNKNDEMKTRQADGEYRPTAINDDKVTPAPPPLPIENTPPQTTARQALRASVENPPSDAAEKLEEATEDPPSTGQTTTLSDLQRAAEGLEERARQRRAALRDKNQTGPQDETGDRDDNTDEPPLAPGTQKVAALRGFLEAVQKDRAAGQKTDTSAERRSGEDRRQSNQTNQAPPPAKATDKEQPSMADAAKPTKEKGAPATAASKGDDDKPHLIAENQGLEVRSLGKQFKKRPILRDVSLRLQRGEAVGLLGPNGAGKTTCFYMISGLIAADYGEILLDGEDITELPMYRRARLGIGYLPQEASIFRGLTVEQNIRAVLEGVEKRRDKREAMLEALMAEFSISHLRRSPAVALSGGERRRLEIARALASQPHFILLDEPLAGIDPIAVRDIRELVSHLKDRGIGVLITDHNVRETLDLVDRAYILHDGRVLMEGTPDEIVGDQEVRRVYLGDRFNL